MPTDNENYSAVRLAYGIHDLLANIGGLSIAEAQLAYAGVLNVAESAEVYLNGIYVENRHTELFGGDRLEFVRTWGRKGADNPHTTNPKSPTSQERVLDSRIEPAGIYLAEARRRLAQLQPEIATQEDFNQIIGAATVDRLRAILKVTPSNGPGRPDATADIAALVDRLRRAGMSWQQCFERCVMAFGEERTGNVERVRAIWRRHFRSKK